MTIISKHVSSSIRLCDSDAKTIHNYHGVAAAAAANNIALFSEAIGDIRGEAVGSTFLTVINELDTAF